MKNPVIGITGIMSSGKSSFCRALSRIGFQIISADNLVQNLYKKNSAGAKALTKLKIKGIVKKDGSVDKPKLRELMFRDKAFRKRVEKLVHPIVISEIKRMLKEKEDKLVAVEIPLLFEAKLDSLCSYTVTVFREKRHSLSVITDKYKIALTEAENMLNAQLGLAEKMIRSDFTIMNTGSIEDLNKKAIILKRSVMTLWKK
jgi:dephospho-CoA kinase